MSDIIPSKSKPITLTTPELERILENPEKIHDVPVDQVAALLYQGIVSTIQIRKTNTRAAQGDLTRYPAGIPANQR